MWSTLTLTNEGLGLWGAFSFRSISFSSCSPTSLYFYGNLNASRVEPFGVLVGNVKASFVETVGVSSSSAISYTSGYSSSET